MTEAQTLTDIAWAKINLALHVRGRMADGNHRIETIFAFAEDGDRLSAAPAEGFSLTIEGPFAEGLSNGDDNLVLRAAAALRSAANVDAGAALRLEKNVPVASGIGGGSADAAAALRLLARLWRAEAPLEPIAATLGADVPACLASIPARGEGKGDALTPVTGDALTGSPVLLINPRIPVPTGLVFQAWDRIDLGPLRQGDPLEAARAGRNDLEPAAIGMVPVIADLVDWLKARRGAVLARMSGSGATCFALFQNAQDRDEASDQAARDLPGFWMLATRLRG